jgi:hypothetical protein
MRQILASSGERPALVVECINRLIRTREYEWARSLIQEHSGKLADHVDFQVAQGSLVVATDDRAAARTLFESETFSPSSVLAKAPTVYLRLLKLVDRRDELEAALHTILDSPLTSADFDQLVSIGAVFAELGEMEKFRRRIDDSSLPGPFARQILEMVSRRVAPSLFHEPDDIPF